MIITKKLFVSILCGKAFGISSVDITFDVDKNFNQEIKHVLKKDRIEIGLIKMIVEKEEGLNIIGFDCELRYFDDYRTTLVFNVSESDYKEIVEFFGFSKVLSAEINGFEGLKLIKRIVENYTPHLFVEEKYKY